MSRYDREDIDFLNLPDADLVDVVQYDGGGNEIVDTKDRVAAKKIVNKDAEHSLISYYILIDNYGMVYDPRQKSGGSPYKRNYWKFKKVSSSVFELYLSFLRNKYSSMLQQVQRRL